MTTFAEVIRQSLLSLTRRKLRTALTTFGICVGIITIVAMVALAAGVQREVITQISGLGLDVVRVTPRVQETGLPRGLIDAPRTNPITEQAVRELAALPGVIAAEPQVAIPLTVDLRIQRNGQEVRVIPRAPGAGFGQFQPRVIAGRGPEGLERGVVLSRAALGRQADAEQIAAMVGQPITVIARAPRGEFEQFTMTVVGVDESPVPGDLTRPEVTIGWRDAVAVLAWWYDTPDILNVQGYDSVTLRAASIAAAPAVSEAVRQRGFQATTIQAVLDAINRVFAVLQALLVGVGGLALFVASLGVVNTMLMAVYERTREIGILKATGASKSDILSLFLVEAGMMGLIAGVAGLIGGWLLSLLVDWIAQQYLRSQQLDFVGSLSFVPPWLAIGSVLFAVLIGVVAGLYPAYRAASMDPVRALRHD